MLFARSSSPTRRARRRRQSLAARLLLALLGCGIGLGAAEVAARGLVYAAQTARPDLAPLGNQELPADREAKLGDLVRRSDDPHLVYEFVPGLRARFQGQDCAINRQGYRGPEWPARERTPGSLRIVGLGDSVMFGWGTAEPDAFLRVLARDLARTAAGPVEVLNLGVPGYNTAMEVAAFERTALAYAPDVVVVDWVGNDADLPNLIADSRSVLDLDNSFLLDLVLTAMGRRSAGATPLQPAPWAGSHFESDPDRVPPAYRDLVGEPGVTKALRRLASLQQQHGFRLLVATHYQAPPFVHRVCAELGIPLVANEAAVRAHLQRRSLAIEDYLTSDLVLSAQDPHPSVAGHALYAATIAAFLRERGWDHPPAPPATTALSPR